MASLKERVRALQEGCGFVDVPRPTEDRRAAWTAYRRTRGGPVQTLASPSGLVQTDILGQERETPFGPCFFREKWVAPEARFPWDELQAWPARLLALWAEDLAPGSLADWVYLDVETTGLGGGVGVLAFLVGLGFWEDGMLRVRQYFLRDLDEEPALLWAVEQDLRGAPGIVTYNGRAYDRHVLWNRMRLYRMELDLRAWPHIDLYPWARSLWSGIWPDVRLQTVEARLWNLERTLDLRGSEIPSAYRLYLTRGWHEALYQVLEHNLQDVRSLAGLALHLARWLHNPGSDGLDAETRFRIARRLLRRDWRWALEVWETVLTATDASASLRTAVIFQGLRVIRRFRAWAYLDRWVRWLADRTPATLTASAWARVAYYTYRYLHDATRARRLLVQALRHRRVALSDRERWKRRLMWLERKRQPPLPPSPDSASPASTATSSAKFSDSWASPERP